jgi:hypothetical protein
VEIKVVIKKYQKKWRVEIESEGEERGGVFFINVIMIGSVS